MNKKTSLLVLIILLFSGFYFYIKEPTDIKITKKRIRKKKTKIQNKYCFCSGKYKSALTACFNPTGDEFAVWNSRINIALTAFKIPFTYGKWKKAEDKIIITFANGEDFEIPHNSKTDGAFPSSINLSEVQLKPEACENIEWTALGKNLETSNDLGFYCSDDEKEMKVNILIDFTDGTFSEYTGDTLLTKESFFIERPSAAGNFQKNGDSFVFQTNRGRKIKAIVTEWDAAKKIPQFITLGPGNDAIEIERNNCPWMKKSLREIPLIKAKNILCEKKQNDLVLNILPGNKLNIYLNTKDFSIKDFVDDKFTMQGTDLELKAGEISFKYNDNLIKGFVKKEGGKIASIRIEKGPSGKLEYSNEYCPPFYLTDKLWK